MDIFVLRAISHEINEELEGARIKRIIQPDRRTLFLTCESTRRQTHRLVLSADPTHSRIHLTDENPQAPAVPADFCRVLRNFLVGARISRIATGERERAVQITVEKTDRSNKQAWYALMAEVMGRWSNIVLVDAGTGLTLDAIRRISAEQNPSRPIVRDAAYGLPSEQDKLRFEDLNESVFLGLFNDAGIRADDGRGMNRWLVRSFASVGPEVASEIAARWQGGDGQMLWCEFYGLMKELWDGKPHPTVILNENGSPKTLVAFIPRETPSERSLSFETMNEAAKYFFTKRVSPDVFAVERDALGRKIGRHSSRLKKTLAAIERDLVESRGADEERLKGELLLENLGSVPEKASAFFSEIGGRKIEIALDPKYTVSENAQRFFRRYKKLRRRAVVAEQRGAAVREKAVFLDGLSFELEEASSPGDLETARAALLAGGFQEKRSRREGEGSTVVGRRAGEKSKGRRWRRFDATDGWQIYVGKNAMGNDALMREVGHEGDLWFHAQGVPGSHVILRTLVGRAENVAPEEAVLQAASLAAYHSKGRGGGRVNVACVPFQKVKRPRGAPPGLVHITGQRTVAASPDEATSIMALLDEIE
ncbi:MAG: fibronectin/fibrinogen-binding protein [Nitrospinaceae bacterium]|jgi:predicted ribosome quality control (RQC) complex YloA/Tae2 family protein|nr:fibronectin/fibrinogen-binding protein [Nitrospinaceae bacterium]MBT3434671.1 fibronectin/fibrinogen-binding protein [Nitrospinaceae bacterium]MBT3821367.1 fibronectin/fibrinogen-binding protein [Nitrospinaceae bacterium]MBT4095921.1 fibronectin/fibrinogen-binding protein [Nitrospinaceae bacterium]MBT4430081.1 fibronectin/fibrinogen-binding protein [Nitrospinaceae bacterium]